MAGSGQLHFVITIDTALLPRPRGYSESYDCVISFQDLLLLGGDFKSNINGQYQSFVDKLSPRSLFETISQIVKVVNRKKLNKICMLQKDRSKTTAVAKITFYLKFFISL